MIWLNEKPSPIRDLGERAEVKVRMGKVPTGAQDQLFPQRVAGDFNLTDHTCFHSVLPVRVVWLGKVDHLLVSAGQSLLVTFPWAPRVPWQRNLQSADSEGKQIHMQDTIIDTMQLHIIKVTHQSTSFGLLEQYFWPILEDPFAVASGRSCQSSTPFNVIYFSEPTVNVIVVCVGNNKWLGAEGANCSRKVFGEKLFYSSRNIVQLFKEAKSNYIHILKY